MPEHARTARETLRLETFGPTGPAGSPLTAPWSVFDPDWYRRQYPDAPAGPNEALLEWHLALGQTLGHSPNRYFDELWQRQAWPGIVELIASGSVDSAFDAWCRGAHATRSPHWLFDPEEYRRRNPALTDAALDEAGFADRYHHYLSHGAAARLIGHFLFEPAIWLAALGQAEAEAAKVMPFQHYLRGLEDAAPECRPSVLFDPNWYRARYPGAAQLIATRRYRSALEHYLCNDTPTEFDPSPWFSEAYYLAENPGVAGAIGPRGFRNGFVHFLRHGMGEGRSPHPDLDFARYAGLAAARADLDTERARDAFEHWIAIGHGAGLPGRAPPEAEIAPEIAPFHAATAVHTAFQAASPEPEIAPGIARSHAVRLYRRRATTILPLYGRHKLDFSHAGTPTISVIMAVRNHFAETMVSLAALRTQYHGEIELILVGPDPVPSAEDIETHVQGATLLRFGGIVDDAAAREAGLVYATAETVLLLGDGIDLAPGAIDSARARLTGDATIGAVGGRLIQPDGLLLEAGGIVWRNGDLQRYARDASPLAAEANFVREIDFCSTMFLLARRDVLAALPEQAVGIAGTTHDAADLCVRIRRTGFRVVYEPDALAFLTTNSSDRQPDGRAAFVAAHADYLSGRPAYDPAAIIHARSPPHARPRVLFIADLIPFRGLGSGFARSNDVVRAIAAPGSMVTVVPMNENHLPLTSIRAGMPDSVEVMHDLTATEFAGFVASRRDCYDVIWIARTHNLDAILGALAEPAAAARRPVARDTEAAPRKRPTAPADTPGLMLDSSDASRRPPGAFDAAAASAPLSETGARRVLEQAFAEPGSRQPRIVVDTEAVTSVKRAARAALSNQTFDLDAALCQEFMNLDPAMHVIAVSEAEAAIIRAHHAGPVTVLGHGIAASPTPRRFEERTGILFVGAIHRTDDPNYDGLAWFIDAVLPLIEHTLRWETQLTVAGYTAPGVSLDRFKGHKRVTLRGAVADLMPLYDAHRVFVAPLRYAAGIRYEVHEAAAFGLPVVATSLLARQAGWPANPGGCTADSTDPADFAARVVALHRDASLWSRVREASLARVAAELDPGDFASRVARLTQSGRVGTPHPGSDS